METKNIYFISGIDTDAGKSYCTAWYARELMQRGLRVITQNSSRPATPVIPRTSTCTAASPEPATCRKTKRG